MRRLRDGSTTDDEEDIPLHHKRPFGAGLKRKRVEFVRATEPDNNAPFITREDSRSAIGDLYASIVLGDGKPQSASAPATRLGTPQAEPVMTTAEPSICSTCSLPITTSAKEHEASVAHQVNMPHAHPPSALDRSRMGLRALGLQGWDPDSRRGLGREGEGVRYPVKAKAKDDTLGIGATMPRKPKQVEPPPRKLTGKELKAVMAREKQQAERLQAEIYGRVDVEGYLNRRLDE